jgi:starch synthase
MPVVGAVMRLVEQKGTAILVPAIRHMLFHAEMQFVLVGTGDARYEADMQRLHFDYPRKAAIFIGFDETLSERVYAGADMFVMPSVFEPCGIGQMIAMRYGTLPVVREVGGLADTVSPEVGFRFSGYSPEGLQSALSDGLYVYYNDRAGWEARQRRAMQQDHSWERSAQRYVEVYEETIQVHRKYN